jgi:solute carrier family 25 (mitochondrial citrate transporter), member 1
MATKVNQNGKKPTSAATNLIGEHDTNTLFVNENLVVTNILFLHSRWWSRYDGSACMPSSRFVYSQTSWHEFRQSIAAPFVRIHEQKAYRHFFLTFPDTIKVRMQLSRRARQPGAPKRGFLKTGAEIVKRETPLGLYKGLGAVLTGIVPKMAIRFTSFEAYKQMLADQNGVVTGKATFLAGLAAGVTEAVAVVTPMEVIKIRLQAQHHSMADPLDIPKYRNAAHALYTVVKEEGAGALYRGVSLTALRQGSNQAVNFTAYTYFKEALYRYQPEFNGGNLPGWQTTVIGLVSGAMGPLSNAPIDTIKTRLQKTPAEPGVSAMQRITKIAAEMFK